MLRSVGEEELAQFPKTIDCDGHQIELRYRFEPGHAEDGVSAVIPIALLYEVPPNAFDWLVPGMIRDKCIALLKSLPKELRRLIVPIPDTTDKILAQISPSKNGLTSSLSDQLSKLYGVRVDEADWQIKKIDDWYRMNFLLIDDSAQVIASSRNLKEVKKKFRNSINVKSDYDNEGDTVRIGIKQWDFPELSEQITVCRGGFLITVWPALRDCEDSVSIELADNIREAESITRQGQCRLAYLKAKAVTRYLSKHLLEGDELLLLAAGLGKRNILVEAFINAALSEAIFGAEKVVRTREEFEQSFDIGISSVAAIAQSLSSQIEELLPSLHHIRKTLISLTPAFEYAKRDIDKQLEFLFLADTISFLTISNASEYRRYITAIVIRLEKIQRNIVRDQESSNQLRRYTDSYDSVMKERSRISICLQNKIKDFYWQIEEYRVSLFAQQLKTRNPVSSKRLDRAWKIISEELKHEPL